MRLPKQTPLPLVQSPQELLSRATNTIIPSFARMQRHVRSPRDKSLPHHGAQIALVEEVEHPCSQPVEVCALVSEGNGSRVGLERGYDLAGHGRGEVQGDGCFGVLGRARAGEGEHLGEPEREGHLCAGLERLSGVVVEVAQFGELELEFARDFLGGCQTIRCVFNGGGISREGDLRTSASVRIESMS